MRELTTSSAFAWIFGALYFVFRHVAGLSAFWVFRQARILAIVIVAEIVYLSSQAIQLANRLPRLRGGRSISVLGNRP